MEQTKTIAPEYHGHPNYLLVFIALVVLFGVSLAFGALPNHTLAITLIFILALAKAYLVAGFFMHLHYESWVLIALPGIAILMAIIFFGLVYPDITIVPLIHAEL
ncbi:MAG: hypothetical protein LDLANPLL_01679 [Turneriella sp.]|nr:hypothetical protein [Turneriella sp.]